MHQCPPNFEPSAARLFSATCSSLLNDQTTTPEFFLFCNFVQYASPTYATTTTTTTSESTLCLSLQFRICCCCFRTSHGGKLFSLFKTFFGKNRFFDVLIWERDPREQILLSSVTYDEQLLLLNALLYRLLYRSLISIYLRLLRLASLGPFNIWNEETIGRNMENNSLKRSHHKKINKEGQISLL